MPARVRCRGYDGGSRGSGGLLIRRLFGIAQAFPLPRQQFCQARDGQIGDAGENVGQPEGFGSISLRRAVVISVSMTAARPE